MPELSEPVFKSAFSGPDEEAQRRGRRPVIFDIVAPDRETSLLNSWNDAPGDIRLVLHVNPQTMSFSYAKQTERVQTHGGWVEFHWGDAPEEIQFDAATGGFMRMYSGLSNITGYGSGDQGRRETIAYDKYLDLLALFHNNGAVYDVFGNIVVQGYIKMTFDGGVHVGWFDGNFSVTEAANQPYMFNMSARFVIDHEEMRFHTANLIGYDGPIADVTDLGTGAQPDTSTTILDELKDPFAQTPDRLLVGGTAAEIAPELKDPFAGISESEAVVAPETQVEAEEEAVAGGGAVPLEPDPVLAGTLSDLAGLSVSQMGTVLTSGDLAAITNIEQATGFSQMELIQILGL